MSVDKLIILVVLALLMSPGVQLLWRAARRLRWRRRIQRLRGVRVVSLVHRMETVAFLGVPGFHFVTVELAEETLTAIRGTPPDTPIDLLVHLPGGVALAGEAIGRALAAHPARTTVVVPQYAFSGALLAALGADEILMDEEAAVGALDLDVEGRAAASVLLARLPNAEAGAIENALRRHADWEPDRPLNAADLRRLGLTVSTELPEECRVYLTLFRQPPPDRPWPVLLRLPPSARRP